MKIAKLELTFLWTVHEKNCQKEKALLLFLGTQNKNYYFNFYYPKFSAIFFF
jgi:hypothetical protein